MRRPSRREFLSALAASLPLSVLRQAFPSAFVPPGGTSALFQPVPPTQSGITWKHSNGRSPSYYLPETTGAGCAFLDFDNDGWMDIYLVNSGPCDFFTPQQPLCNGLYRNNRDGTFTDVTAKAGVPNAGYGMGVAVGDYNGDGYPDMFVTSYNRSTLYRNNGDGTFTDVTRNPASPRRLGLQRRLVRLRQRRPPRSVRLQIRRIRQGEPTNSAAMRQRGAPLLHSPHLSPTHSWLFHNNGDGTFTDVSEASGISSGWARHGARWPPTSITTAGWTCSSPTTPSPIFSA